jgi:hypothetical protein
MYLHPYLCKEGWKSLSLYQIDQIVGFLNRIHIVYDGEEIQGEAVNEETSRLVGGRLAQVD